jgi:cell division protein FtsA
MNERIVVGLDIGTTKVCAIVASIDDQERINILGVGKAKSEGLKRGVVVNIEKTMNAIRSAIEQAERASGKKVKAVNVGIAGDHINSLRSRGAVTKSDLSQEISHVDVKRLIEEIKQIMLPPDQQIIHVIPQEYSVDGQDGIVDPVGMSGMRIEADVHIITGMVSAVKNIYRCVEKAGYEVVDIILEPLASSYAVLAEEEKEAGVVLVDIGGGTTDVAVFHENTIRHTAVIAIGGQKVTDDVRIGLNILVEQAEKLKNQYGEAFVDLMEIDDVIEVPGIAGRPSKEISRAVLCQIIQARMQEILEIVEIEIKRSTYADKLSAGIVFTGGGSLVHNLVPLAQQVTGMDVKVGYPRGLAGGLTEEVNSPIYATAIGLVMHAIHAGQISSAADDDSPSSRISSTQVEDMMSRIKDRMMRWFKEL